EPSPDPFIPSPSTALAPGSADSFAPASELTLYQMPTAGPAPIVNAIDGATTSVDLSIYIMTNRKVIAALQRAAQRGVTVRVMIEPTPAENEGDARKYEQLAKQLRDAGCHVEPTPSRFEGERTFDHAKFMV